MRGKVLGFLVFLAVCLWRLTLRIRFVGVEHRQALDLHGRPVIHAIWHQRMVLGILKHPWSGTVTMASFSADGEIVASFLRFWGFRVARGSSSRGGAQGFLTMVGSAADQGSRRWLALTPDGPRGPARHCKPGVVRLAEELSTPILPVGTSASRPRFLRSWDRFLVPLPFSRCVVLFGPPLERRSDESEPAFLARVDATLDGVTEQADRLCGVSKAPRERTRGESEASS